VSDALLRTPFPERAGAALKDTFLQEALKIATTKFIGLRREAFDDFPEGEALRDRARAIKEATLQHLDQHVERLVDNVERRGGPQQVVGGGPSHDPATDDDDVVGHRVSELSAGMWPVRLPAHRHGRCVGLGA